jgi:hypothetical protein
MTTHANFTQDEWKLLSDVPLLVAAAVAAASPSGMVGTVKEGSSFVTSMLSAAKQYPQNTLIQDVIPRSFDANQMRSWIQTAKGVMQGAQAERLKNEGLDASRRIAQMLDQRSSPQEAVEFKRWLLSIGEGVAKAASEGGAQVSCQETQMLTDLAIALNVTR